MESPASRTRPSSGTAPELKLETLVEMLDNAPSSITVHDPEGRFLYGNRKTFELHGYTQAEFMAMNVSQLDVPAAAELFARRVQQVATQGCATFEVEHYRNDRSLLPLEVTAKQVMWEGRPAILSIATDLTEKRGLQEQAMRHTRDLTMFHLFVVGLANVGADQIHRYIAQSLREFSGAFFVSISDYDPLTRCLTHRHLDVDPGLAGRMIHLLGSRVEEIHTPLSEENYELVTRKGWSVEKSLHDASFGSIPLPVAAAIQKFLQLDRFIGITFQSDDRLFGSSLLAMHRDQPDPSMEMLQAYRQVATIALQQRTAERERRRLLDELQRAQRMEIRGRLITSVAPELAQHLARIRARSEAVLTHLPGGDPDRRDLEEILFASAATAELIHQLETLEP